MESLALIAHILQRMDGTIHGRVQLQKLIYFCKAAGASVDANYRLYVYGPYSQQVADSLQDGVIEEIFQESNGRIEKGENFVEYYESLSEQNLLEGKQGQIVNSVLTRFRDMPVRELEILATTFFIARQQKTLFGSTNQQSVLEKVRKAKSSRFSEEEIEHSYEQMLECQNFVQQCS